MSSRKLDTMAATALPRFLDFEKRLDELGLRFVRACTFRSPSEQDALYARGRTEPGRIVTWVRGGQSAHNFVDSGIPASMAADYYPLFHGKLATLGSEEELDLWETMLRCAEAAGLECGGRWDTENRDYPHIQIPYIEWANG